MKKSKSVTHRLEVIKLNSSLNTAVVKNAGINLEEFPKLRRPKSETLLKLLGHQRNVDNISLAKEVTSEEGKNIGLSLRQEFQYKKEKLEKPTPNLFQKYDAQKSQGNVMPCGMFNLDSDEARQLTLPKDHDLQIRKQRECKPIDTNSLHSIQTLTFSEQLLINIFYTKVNAHPSGFFAENLPDWYKKTFHKDVAIGWLELLQASNKFHVEKVQNKIVLYTKNDSIQEPPPTNIDLTALGDELSVIDRDPKEILDMKSNEHVYSHASGGFVRYKHLEKSLKEYNINADRGKKNNIYINPNLVYKSLNK